MPRRRGRRARREGLSKGEGRWWATTTAVFETRSSTTRSVRSKGRCRFFPDADSRPFASAAGHFRARRPGDGHRGGGTRTKLESEDSEASCSSTEGLVVPEGIPSLRGVRYVHGAFPESFLRQLERVREGTPVTLASGNMYADRRFLRDEALAKEVLRYLPKHLGFAHVLSDMRFIEYPPGGHILPHTDGVRRDQVTGVDSTHSMLFTRDVPEGEGGETEFLDGVGGGRGRRRRRGERQGWRRDGFATRPRGRRRRRPNRTRRTSRVVRGAAQARIRAAVPARRRASWGVCRDARQGSAERRPVLRWAGRSRTRDEA